MSFSRRLNAGGIHRAREMKSRKWKLAAIATFTTAATAATGLGINPSSAQNSHDQIYYGVEGVVPTGSSTLSQHGYSQIAGGVPNDRMISMGTSGQGFAAIANDSGPGSVNYQNLVRWADTLKARGTSVLFNFGHEPEAHDHPLGGPSDFIAAFRRVVDVFRAQGASNVRFVWQMTGYSFSVRSSDIRYAPNWYPGAAYVDDLAIDSYNWDGCGPQLGRTPKWSQLSDLASKGLAFARAHSLHFVLGEYGSQSGPLRGAWLDNAAAFFTTNRDVMDAAFYFNVPDQDNGKGCHVYLGSSDSGDAGTLVQLSTNNSVFTK